MTDILNMRVGQGYDVHRLVADRPLILGGVRIAHEKGLLGHSDADVLLHAVTDAILGACALGTSAGIFPDTDMQHENADSGHLLLAIVRLCRQKGFVLINVDATVVCQSPKLAPHMPAMHQQVAKLCGLPLNQVNIKAKTNEHLGYLGRGEAIEAQAVVLACLQGLSTEVEP